MPGLKIKGHARRHLVPPHLYDSAHPNTNEYVRVCVCMCVCVCVCVCVCAKELKPCLKNLNIDHGRQVRDLLQCQKRPTTVSKETYYSVKRDLLQCQKRPTTWTSTMVGRLETYYSVKRDLLQCQKRPTTVSKETYYLNIDHGRQVREHINMT